MLLKFYQNYSQKIIFLLFIGFAIVFVLMKIGIYNFENKVPISSTVPTNTSTQFFVIKKGEKVLYKKRLTSYGYEVVRWQDWLFYTEQNSESKSTTTVIGLNLQTGETKIILQDTNEERQVSELLVLNNTLYISFGGYFADGAIYWTKLPTLHAPQKLISMPNPSISLVNKTYWIMGGEGDSCWHEGYYAMLDLLTNKVGPIIETHEGCRTEGEAFVGIDKQNRVIVAKHPIQAGLWQGETLYDAPPFSNIVAISPHTLEREILLSEEKMPNNIVEIYFNSNKESLILMGPKIYVYDIDQDTLTYITSYDEHWVRYEILRWSDDGVCISLWDKEGKPSIITHSFTHNVLDCAVDPTPTVDYKQDEIDKTQQLIKDLNLPEGYEVSIKEL